MAVDSTPERSFSLYFRIRGRRSRPRDVRPAGRDGGRQHRAAASSAMVVSDPRGVCYAGQRLVGVRRTDMSSPTSSEWLVLSQWFRRSSAPSGSTSTSAIFWTSRTSHSPRRTSRQWIVGRACGLVGSNAVPVRTVRAIRRSVPNSPPLISWTIAEPGQVNSVGTTRPTPLPLRVGAKHRTAPARHDGDTGHANGQNNAFVTK